MAFGDSGRVLLVPSPECRGLLSLVYGEDHTCLQELIASLRVRKQLHHQFFLWNFGGIADISDTLYTVTLLQFEIIFFNLSHARIWQNIWHIETDESGDPWTIKGVSAVCPYCSAMAALLWFQQWESILLFERKNNELLWLGVSQVQGHLFVEELAETQRDRATVLLNSSPPRSSEESTGVAPGSPYSGRWRLCGLLTVGAGGASRVTGRDTFFSVWISLWLLWIPRILPHWGTCLTGRAQRLAWVHAP